MKHNLLFLVSLALSAVQSLVIAADRLDRRAIVTRHNVVSDSAEMTVPLADGEFCFNADGTGLQTFAGSIFDHRGWFAVPLPEGRTADDVPETGTFQIGRNTGPDVFPEGKADLFEWMTDSLHRMNLGRIRFTHGDGTPIAPDEITGLSRDLDLWTGVHRAEWTFRGETVTVVTAVGADASVAFCATSPALASGELAVVVDFPYPTSDEEKWAGRFDADDLHRTELVSQEPGLTRLERRFGESAFGNFDYAVCIAGDGKVKVSRCGGNAFLLAAGGERLDAAVSFGDLAPAGRPLSSEEEKSFAPAGAPRPPAAGTPPSYFEGARRVSAARWEAYWQKGGAIDLSGSTDPRWFELERRIVLSQYLMKTSASGSYPPSEGGLLSLDQWRGRFHMEMAWWHLAHWFLWGRADEADRPLRVYEKFKEPARRLAAQLDMSGYQWQKCLGPEGRTAPWTGNQVLLWKEPHPIFFAELDYRARPSRATLERWADLVEGTALYMADYALLGEDGFYHLSPVMPPSEVGFASDTAYDLAYWQLGLRWANRWRRRLDETPNAEWDRIARSMAPLPKGENGLYLRTADWPVWKEWEHPDLIGAFGQFPPLEGQDPETARATLGEVIRRWDWNRCWGWDFPWTAMAAARLGDPDLAVDFLLSDHERNAYDGRGVNTGGPCPYLPGNGGLLYAVAMMAAGWESETDAMSPPDPPSDGVHETAPGFPAEGWRVRWEGLLPAP
ncbi:MAG: hypothetical protein IKE69_04915 [Thermoguttaceae bacterium]|nr:hypothetical protein [Thermoguttaceae bacterium]